MDPEPDSPLEPVHHGVDAEPFVRLAEAIDEQVRVLDVLPVPPLVALDRGRQLGGDRNPPRLLALGSRVPADAQLDPTALQRVEHQVRQPVRSHHAQAAELRLAHA